MKDPFAMNTEPAMTLNLLRPDEYSVQFVAKMKSLPRSLPPSIHHIQMFEASQLGDMSVVYSLVL